MEGQYGPPRGKVMETVGPRALSHCAAHDQNNCYCIWLIYSALNIKN
ncbi:hypothetical protein RvY_11431 [Ramazzottius varieornatus]|uniref:Uncharacterized protein n=1 Tax=Ramazzottius varieornatus TaxID=947166 RepID=A0A1D1VG39_RAMVA|nr:hypothetical protein RvY_11431 [Ramazzottius varieornatus]